jgi:hypothetical protein
MFRLAIDSSRGYESNRKPTTGQIHPRVLGDQTHPTMMRPSAIVNRRLRHRLAAEHRLGGARR